MEEFSEEQELQRLEAEIESAVNRFFVERKAESVETSVPEAGSAPPIETEVATEDHPPTAPAPVLVKNPVEDLEAHLLSLEWEITPEVLQKAKKEAVALRNALSLDSESASVLEFIEHVLTCMASEEKAIRPEVMTFLLDCKNTLRLLIGGNTNEATKLYNHLAYAGIQARFSSLFQESAKESAPPVIEQGGAREEILGLQSRMDLLSEKIDNLAEQVGRLLQERDAAPEAPSLPVDVTIFKIGEKLFGVPSEKVYKLYKVPGYALDRYSDQERIRTKDMELKIIDTAKRLAAERDILREEPKLLALREDEEYKGMLIDAVLRTVSAFLEPGTQTSCFAGTIRWMYERNPVTVPVLNVKEL